MFSEQFLILYLNENLSIHYVFIIHLLQRILPLQFQPYSLWQDNRLWSSIYLKPFSTLIEHIGCSYLCLVKLHFVRSLELAFEIEKTHAGWDLKKQQQQKTQNHTNHTHTRTNLKHRFLGCLAGDQYEISQVICCCQINLKCKNQRYSTIKN